MGKKFAENKLLQHAFNLGVSDVKIISVEEISVEDRFAKMCEEPRCDGYGQSVNCPPHVMGPDEFREYIIQYKLALIFKFDVPTETLLSDDRWDVARIIHETAANIEQFAIDKGFTKSKGFAVGYCKRLFCSKYDKCRALNEGDDCRFPNLARPSMSGFGINFFKIAKMLGWHISKITRESNPNDVHMGMMAGMVLIG